MFETESLIFSCLVFLGVNVGGVAVVLNLLDFIVPVTQLKHSLIIKLLNCDMSRVHNKFLSNFFNLDKGCLNKLSTYITTRM